MNGFLLRRFAQAPLVLLGVSLVVFLCLHLTGDPAALMLPPSASAQEIMDYRHAMGFDLPLWQQYLNYLNALLHGNLGVSQRYGQPVGKLILERVPATVLLAVVSLAWSPVAGFALGIGSAVFKDRWTDLLLRLIALSGQAIPVFWLGLLLIILFSLDLHWLPTGGYGDAKHLVMPSIALGAYYMSAIARLVRASLIEALASDYVRTARAKGLSSKRIVIRHALRNALIPVITVQGMYFASLLGGALVTEILFAWPGIGRLAVQAIENRDFQLVQAIVLLSAVAFVVVNLITDLLYVVLNPRIRL